MGNIIIHWFEDIFLVELKTTWNTKAVIISLDLEWVIVEEPGGKIRWLLPELSISPIYCPADANNAENQTYDFTQTQKVLKKTKILVPCCTIAS